MTSEAEPKARTTPEIYDAETRTYTTNKIAITAAEINGSDTCMSTAEEKTKKQNT